MTRTRLTRLVTGALLGWSLLSATSRLEAATSTGTYLMFGAGMHNCATALGYGQLTLAAVQWMAGYLTSFNVYQPETFDVTGGSVEWQQWVAEYCVLNPTHTLTMAAM